MLPLRRHPWQVVLVSHGSESCNLPANRRLLRCHLSSTNTHEISCNSIVPFSPCRDLKYEICSPWPESRSSADSRSRTAYQLAGPVSGSPHICQPRSTASPGVSHTFSISSLTAAEDVSSGCISSRYRRPANEQFASSCLNKRLLRSKRRSGAALPSPGILRLIIELTLNGHITPMVHDHKRLPK